MRRVALPKPLPQLVSSSPASMGWAANRCPSSTVKSSLSARPLGISMTDLASIVRVATAQLSPALANLATNAKRKRSEPSISGRVPGAAAASGSYPRATWRRLCTCMPAEGTLANYGKAWASSPLCFLVQRRRDLSLHLRDSSWRRQSAAACPAAHPSARHTPRAELARAPCPEDHVLAGPGPEPGSRGPHERRQIPGWPCVATGKTIRNAKAYLIHSISGCCHDRKRQCDGRKQRGLERKVDE